MNETDAIQADIEKAPAPSVVEMALHIYESRRERILETAEDETAYRNMLSSFQKASKELGRQARGVYKYNEDTDQRIKAREILDELKQDLENVSAMGYVFVLAHEEAGEIEAFDKVSDDVLDLLNLHGRISATIENIKRGKDANIIERDRQLKAIAFAGPKSGNDMTSVVNRGQSEFHTMYPYPLTCPPQGEMVPWLPKNYEKFLMLPVDEMDLGDNGAVSIPQGYQDADGDDLTNLWRVDWETSEVSAGLTDEDTQNGTLEWRVFLRDYPGKEMPDECRAYWKRLVPQEFKYSRRV